jgi:hypothetical protein
MRVSETIRVNLTEGTRVIAVNKRIALRNSVFAIRAVSSVGIYPDNGTPDVLRTFVDMQDPPFGAASIPNAHVQQSIIFITGLCQRIESDFLNAV